MVICPLETCEKCGEFEDVEENVSAAEHGKFNHTCLLGSFLELCERP